MAFEPSLDLMIKLMTATADAQNAVDMAAREIASLTGDNPFVIKNDTDLLPQVNDVGERASEFVSRNDFDREIRRLNRITRKGEQGKLSQLVEVGTDEPSMTTKYMVEENTLQQSRSRQAFERELSKRGIGYERVPVMKADKDTGEITYVWQGGHKVYETVGKTPSDEREIQKLRDRGVVNTPTMLRAESVKENNYPFVERFGETQEIHPTSYIRTPEQLVKGVQADRIGRGRLNNYFDQYQNVLEVAVPDNPYSKEIVDIIAKMKEELPPEELEQIYYEIDTDPEMEAGSIEYMYSDAASPLMPRLKKSKEAWEKLADRHGIDYESADIDDVPELNGAMDYAPISEQFALAKKGLL